MYFRRLVNILLASRFRLCVVTFVSYWVLVLSCLLDSLWVSVVLCLLYVALLVLVVWDPNLPLKSI